MSDVVGRVLDALEEVAGRDQPERPVAVYLVRDGRIARERLLA